MKHTAVEMLIEYFLTQQKYIPKDKFIGNSASNFNFESAYDEITDLQNKVILKSLKKSLCVHNRIVSAKLFEQV